VILQTTTKISLQLQAARAAKLGDALQIDFEGFLDGVAFDGGKGRRPSVLSWAAIHSSLAFEEQLVGAKKGDEKTIKVTFPAAVSFGKTLLVSLLNSK
jgi:FKBP-type peptidyl-prolyl cis-trans isomerase (trigger factor)